MNFSREKISCQLVHVRMLLSLLEYPSVIRNMTWKRFLKNSREWDAMTYKLFKEITEKGFCASIFKKKVSRSLFLKDLSLSFPLKNRAARVHETQPIFLRQPQRKYIDNFHPNHERVFTVYSAVFVHVMSGVVRQWLSLLNSYV